MCASRAERNKYCYFDSFFATKQGLFWPWWPRILSNDADWHGLFDNVNNSFGPKSQISTPQVRVLLWP